MLLRFTLNKWFLANFLVLLCYKYLFNFILHFSFFMEVLPPPPLLILVSEAHFKRKFVSKQIAVQKSICVWTLAAIAHLWELSNGTQSVLPLEKLISLSRVESKMGSVSHMKTLSTSEMTHGLLILHTPENLEDKEYIFTFHQGCASLPPLFTLLIVALKIKK